jgi:hypothetical protein
VSEARQPDPLWSRLLSERGLGTMLAVVLVGALLYFGVRFISDAQAFQTSMVAESARTNEKLEQLQIAHAQQAIQIDRIEALLLSRSGP